MLNSKSVVIFLSVICTILGASHDVARRFWLWSSKTTTAAPTTLEPQEATTASATTETLNFTFPDGIVTGYSILNLSSPLTSTTESSGFLSFIRTGLKDIPVLNVLQDTLVKTVDNAVDLPKNLIEGVKSGNPLNVVKTVVKALPVVDENLVDKGFDIVQDQIVNLPSTFVEGAKKGVGFVNSSISLTEDVLSNVLDPLTGVVSSGLSQGADLLNVTGGVLGRVLDPVAYLGVGVVNGTGNVVGKVTDGVSGLLSALGLPLFIVLSIIILGVIIAALALVICGIRRCIINKRTRSYIPFTPGKHSNAEDTTKLLP